MLELYYDFLDKYLERSDFELIEMDTNSMYMAISGEFDENVKPELRSQYDHGGKGKFFSVSKYHNRTPGLFKAEFQGKRMITLTSKCCYADDGESRPKISCKGVSKKQYLTSWARSLEALNGSIDRATNKGFRLHKEGIMTYAQDKLGLSAYYDKRIVHLAGIHTKPLW